MENKNKNRKSIRLKEYDYSEPNDYFVTICTKDGLSLFGEIKENEMILNEVGKIVERCWLEIPNHFPNVGLDIFQIMPNHIHFILRILSEENDGIGCRGAIHCAQIKNASNQEGAMNCAHTGGFSGSKNPSLNHSSLSMMIRWFKGRATFEIRKKGFGFEWHRGFYEHIIRNNKSYNEIYSYIESNPATWNRDRNNPNNIV